MDVASLTLGIIGIILSFIPFCNIASLPCTIPGLVLGIVSINDKSKGKAEHGRALAGIILSGLGILICIIVWVILIVYVNKTGSSYEYDYSLFMYNSMML